VLASTLRAVRTTGKRRKICPGTVFKNHAKELMIATIQSIPKPRVSCNTPKILVPDPVFVSRELKIPYTSFHAPKNPVALLRILGQLIRRSPPILFKTNREDARPCPEAAARPPMMTSKYRDPAAQSLRPPARPPKWRQSRPRDQRVGWCCHPPEFAQWWEAWSWLSWKARRWWMVRCWRLVHC